MDAEIARLLGDSLDGDPTRDSHRVGEETAERRTWKRDGGRRVDVFHFHSGRRALAIGVFSPEGGGDASPEEIVAGFAFLD